MRCPSGSFSRRFGIKDSRKIDVYRKHEGYQGLEKALKEAGIKRGDIQKVGGTGSGKGAIRIADNRVNDIKAISKAANYFFPNARTVADVGAEEGRAALPGWQW